MFGASLVLVLVLVLILRLCLAESRLIGVASVPTTGMEGADDRSLVAIQGPYEEPGRGFFVFVYRRISTKHKFQLSASKGKKTKSPFFATKEDATDYGKNLKAQSIAPLKVPAEGAVAQAGVAAPGLGMEFEEEVVNAGIAAALDDRDEPADEAASVGSGDEEDVEDDAGDAGGAGNRVWSPKKVSYLRFQFLETEHSL
jgi:hypothetical protein